MIRALVFFATIFLASIAADACPALAGMASPKRGMIFFDALAGEFKGCDGTSWHSFLFSANNPGACKLGELKLDGVNVSVCTDGNTRKDFQKTAPDGTCAAGQNGLIAFEDPTGKFYFCIGTNRYLLADGIDGDPCEATNPTIGVECKDGTIYVGKFRVGSESTDLKYFTTPSGCDSSYACPGNVADSLTKPWTTAGIAVGGVDTVTTGSTSPSTINGSTNTAYISPGGDTDDNASTYCKNMTFGGPGKNWFLPSKSEMAFLLCNMAAPGANLPQEDPNCTNYRPVGATTYLVKNVMSGSGTVNYWTSTQTDAGSRAWYMNLGATSRGSQSGATLLKTNAYRVRCMYRK